MRRDRIGVDHGGICTYIKTNINFTFLEDLQNPNYEVLWLKLRPARLPRGYSSIVLGTVYHPPSANDRDLLQYLHTCLSSIESRFLNCGILLVGDFNRMNTSRLRNNYNLKQIVNFPTRGSRTLDLVLTNLKQFYKDPIQRPPHGLSDHMSVEIQPPRSRSQLRDQRRTIKSRDLRPSNRLALRSYLEAVDVNAHTNTVNSCAEKVTILESIVQVGMDYVLPLRSKTIYPGEPPWVNSTLKDLIRRRQRALKQGNFPLFRLLRNRVNRERKACRAKYYDTKVAHLKDCNPSSWWSEVKKLSGLSSMSSSVSDLANHLQCPDGTPEGVVLAKTINEAFLFPMRIFEPLPNDYDPQQNDASGEPSAVPYMVTADSVFLKLSSLNPKKATGPDGIPAWLIKENADLLLAPITNIINSSFSEGRLPPSWKTADIAPIAKQKQVQDVNKDLRPISLTPVLSKVAEEFVVEEHVRRL